MADEPIPGLYDYPGTGPVPDDALFVARNPLDGTDYRVSGDRLPTASATALAELLVAGSGIVLTVLPDGRLQIAASGGGVGTPTTQLYAPLGLAVPINGSEADPSWQSVVNASGYQLQRAPVVNSLVGAYATIYRGADLSYIDQNLAAGTYAWRVLSLGSGLYSNSSYSNVVQATVATGTVTPTQLATPTLSVTLNGTEADLLASTVTGATGYRFERAPVTSGTVGAFALVISNTSASYADTGLAAGTYAWRALAVGNTTTTSDSAYSNIVQQTVAAGGTLKKAVYLATGNSWATTDYSNGDWRADLSSRLVTLHRSKTAQQLAAIGLTQDDPQLIYLAADGTTILANSGETTPQMDTRDAQYLDPLITADKAYFVITLNEPFNGTRTDAPTYTPQQAADNYNAYALHRKAAGARKVIAFCGCDDRYSGPNYNQPPGTYAPVRDQIVAALGAQKTAGTNKWDALALCEPAFDLTNSTFSPDEIHSYLIGYTQFHNPRIVYAVNEALFGVAQPAAVTAPIVAPTISSFSPGSVAVGDTVTVVGTHFTSGTLVVKQNGVTATSVAIASDTQLTFTVPTGATSGAFTIGNSAGTATSATALTVTSGSGGGSNVEGPYKGPLAFSVRTANLQNSGAVFTSAGGDWSAARGADSQYKRAANTQTTIWLNRQSGDEFCVVGFHLELAATAADIVPIAGLAMGLWLVDDSTYGPNINIIAGGQNMNIGITSLSYSWYGVRVNYTTKRIEIVATNDDPQSATPTIVVITPADSTKNFPSTSYTDAALFPVLLINTQDAPNGGRGRNVTLIGGTPL